MASKFKFVFFVPAPNLEDVKSAIFEAGAGRYPGAGNYSECAWQTLGTGQFRPGDSANPHIGAVGVLEKVEEFRVEMLCVGEDVARKAVEALKLQVYSSRLLFAISKVIISAHPYEEPAFEIYRLENF
jgi:hypothetical protein